MEEVKKSLEDRYSELESALNLIQKSIATTTSGTYAEREHLDSMIGDITNRKTPFLDMIGRTKANGMSFEWDMVTAIGSEDPMVAECGNPVETKSTRTRYTVQLKTAAKYVEVCDKAQKGTADHIGDLLGKELQLGMKSILQYQEKLGFYGDSGSNTLEYDGLYVLVDDNAGDNMVNGGGVAITEAGVEAAIQAVFDATGEFPNTMFLGPKQMKDLTDALVEDKIVYNDPKAGGLSIRKRVATYESALGAELELVTDYQLTATNSPNANSDVFLTTIEDISVIEYEPMYMMDLARTGLSEKKMIVWDLALKVDAPQRQAVIYNVA